MCCFSATTTVYGTQIFARFTRAGTQALVYQMAYAAEEPTAMILPVPIAAGATESSLRFVNLKEYPSFFGDLARGYPRVERGFAYGASKSAAAADTLAVQDVGDFVASFVPSMRDFGRINPRFVIKPEVWQAFPAYGRYGFAVFQLKELKGSPHPIAFEFDTASTDQLFLPTVHVHDGTAHERDEFDHVLYVQDATIDAHAGSYEDPDHADATTGLVRSKETAASFADTARARGLVEPKLLVHKTTLRVSLPNRDTFVDLKRIDAMPVPRGCSRCDVGARASLGSVSLPVGIGALGLAWILRRRDRLRRA